MTAKIFHFQDFQSIDGENSLQVITDDFSVRVISKTDKRFWVRMKYNRHGAIIVTDFNPGNLPQASLNIALRKAVDALGASDLSLLTFKDIASGEVSKSLFEEKIKLAVDSIKRACESIARIHKSAVSSLQIQPNGHKFDLIVSIA